MTRMNGIAVPPSIVANYFERRFSWPDKYEFRYYWYWSSKLDNKRKIYGCEVYKDGEYYHNATQADLETYKEMTLALS